MGRRGVVSLAFVTTTESTPGPREHWLCQWWGLTNAEAELTVKLARGQSLEAIAAERGVALSTARSQLRSVFGKTQTKRQAELVALVLAASPRI